MHVELGFLILFDPEKGYITGYYIMSPESSNSEFPFQPNTIILLVQRQTYFQDIEVHIGF